MFLDSIKKKIKLDLNSMKSYLSTCLKHQQTLLVFQSHDYGNKIDIFFFQNDST